MEKEGFRSFLDRGLSAAAAEVVVEGGVDTDLRLDRIVPCSRVKEATPPFVSEVGFD